MFFKNVAHLVKMLRKLADVNISFTFRLMEYSVKLLSVTVKPIRGSSVVEEHPHQHFPEVSLVALSTLISRLKAPKRCFELDRRWIFFSSFSTNGFPF